MLFTKEEEEMKRKIMTGILCLMLMAGAMGQTKAYIERQKVQQELAEKVLRFHVRANSDSPDDQALKLKVRDAVGSRMTDYLDGVQTRRDCIGVVNEHLDDIVTAAETVITEEGYSYPIEAYVTTVDFPDKTYGEYTFPAGSYQALEVIIGSGTGHNWWCVMYPNMCFSGNGYEVVGQNAKESLQSTISDKEYRTLMEEKNYTVKCKYLKFLNPYLEKLQDKNAKAI